MPGSLSVQRRTAVFNPLNEKSSSLPFILASVNFTPFAFPCGANWSIKRAARIPEPEQLRHLVVCFPGGIISSFSQKSIGPRFADFKQVSMAAADDQRQCRKR